MLLCFLPFMTVLMLMPMPLCHCYRYLLSRPDHCELFMSRMAEEVMTESPPEGVQWIQKEQGKENGKGITLMGTADLQARYNAWFVRKGQNAAPRLGRQGRRGRRLGGRGSLRVQPAGAAVKGKCVCGVLWLRYEPV